MVSGISDLYVAQNNWKVNNYDGSLPRKSVQSNEQRFSGPIDVLDPTGLREVARDRFAYSFDKLCFS
jgi:hypothetical protein